MSERRQFIGLTTGESSQFTGLNREITIDTQVQTIRVHDGYTPGGVPLANASLSNVSQSSINTVLNNFGAEKTANKVTQVSALSTNEQYPSAKLLYQQLNARPEPEVGDIKYSLQSSNHNGWLLCNGQAVSRTAYPLLFQLIGSYFGAGDGSTTFNVPNYQGCFMRMIGGDAYGVYNQQPESLPNITGQFFGENPSQQYQFSGAFYADSTQTVRGIGDSDGDNYPTIFNAALSNPIYGGAHVTPVNYLISYRLKVAAAKLSDTEKKINTISTECGFNSIDYFCRVFKKQYHISPGKYRKNKLGR